MGRTNRGQYQARFRVPGPLRGTEWFWETFRKKNEAELAIAMMKAEWLYQYFEDRGQVEVVKEMLRFGWLEQFSDRR